MRFRIPFLLLALLAASASTRAAVEREFERALTVRSNARVLVDLAYGSIRVKETEGREVRVRILQSVDAPDEAAAEKELKNLILTADVNGEDILVVRGEDRRSVRWSWEKWQPFAVAAEIEVPSDVSLDLLTREGDITVGAIAGDVRVRTQGGSVFVGKVAGAVEVRSARGDVTVVGCSGALRIHAAGGNVTVGQCGGTTEISAAAGAIELQEVGGRLKATSSGGMIRTGFRHPISAPAELRTGGGELVVSVDLRSSATLFASTSSPGTVRTRDFEATTRAGSVGSGRWETDVNGGGPLLMLRAGGGNILLIGVPEVR